MARNIKYGMVGGHVQAFIGDVHRKSINFDPRAELVAGCFSRDAELNKKTAEVYGIDSSRTYADYKAMAKEESSKDGGIDFVVVVTPNNTHYEICKAFLEAGIHVVCDKPLCFEVAEAEELVKLSKEKGLIFGVTYTYVGYAMVKVMREMVQGGVIGDIVNVNAEYAQDWLLGELDKDNKAESNIAVWRMDPKYSGAANCVGDIGTHIECTVAYVTGLRIKRLLAITNKFGYPLDFNANIILEYDNGVNGAYWCSQLAAGRANGLAVRVYGTKGSLEWEQHYPDYVRYTPAGEASRMLSRGCGYIKEDAGSYSRIPPGHPEGLYIGFANTYKNIISSVEKIKAGQKPDKNDLDFPNAEHGLDGVKFVHAVVESAKNNSAWVSL